MKSKISINVSIKVKILKTTLLQRKKKEEKVKVKSMIQILMKSKNSPTLELIEFLNLKTIYIIPVCFVFCFFLFLFPKCYLLQKNSICFICLNN